MKINADLVKKLRAEKPWSQEQLSDACGLSVRTIQRLENAGKASLDSVQALATAFNIDPNDLIFHEAEADKEPTPLDAIKTGFVEFADFSGTATRYEYWWFFLFILLLLSIASLIHNTALQIVSVIILLPFMAIGVRRLNDVGQSGWWQLFWFVPFGQIVVIYFLVQEGKDNVGRSGAERLDVA